MFKENKEIIVLFVILAIGIYLIYYQDLEGYDSATFRSNDLDNYYLWRGYGHDAMDHERLNKYPYNYAPKPHPKRYTRYDPYFYQYGYGHL